MKCWILPAPELREFASAVKGKLSSPLRREEKVLLHWAMLSAAYPFWFNVGKQVGRLLQLQNQITKKQIVMRLKEQYGDRQTVSRVTRYVIRSFVAWNVLKDTNRKGCYEQGDVFSVYDQDLLSLLFESVLYTIPEGKITINDLVNNPGLAFFNFPLVSGEQISRVNQRIDVIRFGRDEEILGHAAGS